MPSLVTTGPSALQAPLFVLAFLWVSVALGRRLLIWLGVRGDAIASSTVAERIVVWLALGAGTLQLVPLALGVAGALRVWPLRIAVIVVAAALALDLRSTAAEILGAIKRPRDQERWRLYWLIALVPGVLLALLLALGPAIDADGLGYHLTVPKRWLASGSMGYLPTYPNSNMPMGVEMLYTIALAFTGDTGAKVLHFAFATAGAVGLYRAGVRLGGNMVGATAVTIFLFGPLGVAPLMGWAYLEGVTSFATIASTLAWLLWREKRELGWLRTAFVIAGFGVSFKITAGLFPLGLAALTLVVDSADAQRTRSGGEDLRRIAPAVALCVPPILPWLVRAALVTGNPFFPMFARYLPSRDFSPELAAKWEHFNRYWNWGTGFGGANWSLGERRTILVAFAAILVLAGAIVLVFVSSRIARGTTAVILAVLLAQVGAVGLYLRYWIPLCAVLQLPVLALCAKALAGRWQQLALVAVALLASLGQFRRGSRTVSGDIGGLVRVALGVEAQRDFLARHLVLFPLFDQVNHELPEGSRILLTYQCGGFHIDHTTYCADIVQGALRMDTWDDFVADLRRLGVTHVMAPYSLATGGAEPPLDRGGVGMMVRDEEHACVSRLLTRYGQLRGTAADQGLYAIDPSAL